MESETSPAFAPEANPAAPIVGPVGSENEAPFPYPPQDLIESDGEPLESHWHADEINLLLDVVNCHFQGREDYYAGGNMFIYFNREQARNLDYRGPDFFFVNGGVKRTPMRRYWAIWDEGGRSPDVVVELLSQTTKQGDLTIKKDIYEKTLKTHEYFAYDPDSRELLGWRLGKTYAPIEPDVRGWLWSEQLGLWLGFWQGFYLGYDLLWLRFFDADGRVVPTFAETARQKADAAEQQLSIARQQADAEKQRADALAAELAQLRAQMQKNA
jgi:Uma2 family endonuclease